MNGYKPGKEKKIVNADAIIQIISEYKESGKNIKPEITTNGDIKDAESFIQALNNSHNSKDILKICENFLRYPKKSSLIRLIADISHSKAIRLLSNLIYNPEINWAEITESCPSPRDDDSENRNHLQKPDVRDELLIDFIEDINEIFHAEKIDFVQLFEDSDPCVRNCVIHHCVNLNNVSRYLILCKGLKDNSIFVRRSAINEIIKVNNSDIPKIIIDCLKDPDEQIREIATKYMWACKSDIIIKELCSVAISDSRKKVRDAAFQTIVSCRKEKPSDFIAPYLSHPKRESQWRAIKMLIEFHDYRCIEYLNTFIDSSLSQCKEERDFQKIISFLNDASTCEDKIIREKSYLALTKIGDISSIETLCNALVDPNCFCKRRIVKRLIAIPDTKAIDSLHYVLNNEDYLIRRYAVIALGIIGHPESFQPLSNLLFDSNLLVRSSVILSLVKILNSDLLCNSDNNAIIKTIFNQAASLVSSENQKIQDDVLTAISVIISKALCDFEKYDVIFLVSQLLDLLKKRNSAVQNYVISLLIEIRDPSTIPGLFDALNQGWVNDRRIIVYAISKINSPSSHHIRSKNDEGFEKVTFSPNFSGVNWRLLEIERAYIKAKGQFEAGNCASVNETLTDIQNLVQNIPIEQMQEKSFDDIFSLNGVALYQLRKYREAKKTLQRSNKDKSKK